MPPGQMYSNYTFVTSLEAKTVPPTLPALVGLSHHRWVIPLVAAMGSGQRFAVLCSLLDINRQSLRRALAATDELGLTLLNPGYGHPLRPEYILTPRGKAIAPQSRDVVRAAEDGGWSDLLAKKWSLPVLAAVRMGAARYSEIEAALSTASPRAIARSLEALADAGCIRRELFDERPPRPSYSVTPEGQHLAQCGVALADAAGRVLG
ncbi:MAG: helix-turn-helix domain-containing protein [Acidobacteriota bacterium]